MIGTVISGENDWREILSLPHGTVLIEEGSGRACQVWIDRNDDPWPTRLTYADSGANMWQARDRHYGDTPAGTFVGTKPDGPLTVVWVPE